MSEENKAKNNMLTIAECSLLLAELRKSINDIVVCGLSIDERFAHVKFNTVHYKRLVRLYDKIDEIFLQMLDEQQQLD